MAEAPGPVARTDAELLDALAAGERGRRGPRGVRERSAARGRPRSPARGAGGVQVKRLVLVVGVGRSGTSLLAGVLGQLGFHIPQPRRRPTTRTRGASASHAGRGLPHPADARGCASSCSTRDRWRSRRRAAATGDAKAGRRAEGWLAGELAQSDAVVVKDPRVGWFLGLWRRCCDELDASTSQITMLRHPAEILTSARKSYGTWQSTPAAPPPG